jgi:ornithine cyclodeaminase/alanine dehydrogenase
VQARAHLLALRALFPIADLRCFSRRRATAEAFAAWARGLGLAATVAASAAEAVAERDIVITSVPRSAELVPDLSPTLLAPGCFVGAPDLARSWIGAEAKGFERILTEDVAQSRKLGAKGMIPWADRFDASLADLVAGACDWRPDPAARTMFVHAGIGLTDVAVAHLAVQRARARGIGRMLDR